MPLNGSIELGKLGPLDDEVESICDSGIVMIDSLTAQAIVMMSGKPSLVETGNNTFDGSYGLLWRNVMAHATGTVRFDWSIVRMGAQLTEMLALISSEPFQDDDDHDVREVAN